MRTITCRFSMKENCTWVLKWSLKVVYVLLYKSSHFFSFKSLEGKRVSLSFVISNFCLVHFSKHIYLYLLWCHSMTISSKHGCEEQFMSQNHHIRVAWGKTVHTWTTAILFCFNSSRLDYIRVTNIAHSHCYEIFLRNVNLLPSKFSKLWCLFGDWSYP